MSLKSVLAKIFAKIIVVQTKKWANNPVQTQQKVFDSLIRQAENTKFGQDHNFRSIRSFDDFANFILTKWLPAKKIFYGKANRFILQKLQAQHRGQNTFH
jgi:GH3 auxin-responsive promoter